MNIKKNIIKVFSANLLTLVVGIITGLIIPNILSIDSFAYFKTYILYAGYIGLLHFGFIDGMYIKYGGENIEEVDKSILKAEHLIFIAIQSIATIIFIFIAFIKKDFIIFMLGISIIPINTSAFYKLFYQSTGQFSRFAAASYIYSIIYLSINIILAFVLKSDNYKFYCFANLISNLVVFVILEFKFYKDFKDIKLKYNSTIWGNIKIGFVVLIANLGIVIFNALDLWFVKFNFSSHEFAYYSFAISILNIINIMVSSVSITFYNYLAREEKEESVKNLKKYFIIIGAFFSLAYFVFALIVNVFLEKYIPALKIISISFAGFPYIIVINGLFINLYRARKDEVKYLKVMISMLIISIIYNTIAVVLFDSVTSIAFATLLAFITWFIYSGYDFKYLNLQKKEMFYLISITSSFLVCSNLFSDIVGGIIYGILFLILTILLYKKDLILLIKSSGLIKKNLDK